MDSDSHWEIAASSYIDPGDTTDDITEGLTNEATTFVDGKLIDSGDETGSIALGSD